MARRYPTKEARRAATNARLKKEDEAYRLKCERNRAIARALPTGERYLIDIEADDGLLQGERQGQ